MVCVSLSNRLGYHHLILNAGLLDHLSAPNTPAALTSVYELQVLKEKQQALEERLQAQQRLLCDALLSDQERGVLVSEMTQNLAQYTTVLAQMTECINTRRATAVIATRTIKQALATPVAATPATRSPRSQSRITAPLSEEDDCDDDYAAAAAADLAVQEVEEEEEEEEGVYQVEQVPAVRVLKVKHVQVPRSDYAAACKKAQAELIAERGRLLDEGERILSAMARRK